MAAIYPQALQVLCWLGEDEGNHAERAFYFATRLSEKLQPRLDGAQRISLKVGTDLGVTLDPKTQAIIGFTDDDLKRELRDNSYLEDLDIILQKPWFSACDSARSGIQFQVSCHMWRFRIGFRRSPAVGKLITKA